MKHWCIPMIRSKDGSFSSEYPKLGEDCIMALIYGNNRNIMESRRNSGLYDDDEAEYKEDDDEQWNQWNPV